MTSIEVIRQEIEEIKETLKRAEKFNFQELAEQCKEDIKQYNQVLKDLEILEEIRDYFKVIDYGEGYQNRYALQVMYPYPAGFIYPIRKDVYDKWNRWLGNEN